MRVRDVWDVLVCGCGLEVLILSLVVVSCTWPCKK